jgi:hypothetical protein
MPNAQFDLGRFYECGDGVLQDLAEAARLYRLAAAQGHAGARRRPLRRLRGCGDWQQRRAMLIHNATSGLAAAQGHADAQCSLGCLYGEGKGVAQDFVEAARLWRQRRAMHAHSATSLISTRTAKA